MSTQLRAPPPPEPENLSPRSWDDPGAVIVLGGLSIWAPKTCWSCESAREKPRSPFPGRPLRSARALPKPLGSRSRPPRTSRQPPPPITHQHHGAPHGLGHALPKLSRGARLAEPLGEFAHFGHGTADARGGPGSSVYTPAGHTAARWRRDPPYRLLPRSWGSSSAPLRGPPRSHPPRPEGVSPRLGVSRGGGGRGFGSRGKRREVATARAPPAAAAGRGDPAGLFVSGMCVSVCACGTPHMQGEAR